MRSRRARNSKVAAAGLVALGLLASACGSGATDSPTAVEGDTAEAAETAESTDTTEASDSSEQATGSVVLPAVSGSQIDFGSVEGTDTVLWFWAPW